MQKLKSAKYVVTIQNDYWRDINVGLIEVKYYLTN